MARPSVKDGTVLEYFGAANSRPNIGKIDRFEDGKTLHAYQSTTASVEFRSETNSIVKAKPFHEIQMSFP